LAVNLEPCLMCMGAAMALKVDEVYFGLESPTDGGAAVAADRTAPSAHRSSEVNRTSVVHAATVTR
jgi:tRNA(adenine34) deaminase